MKSVKGGDILRSCVQNVRTKKWFGVVYEKGCQKEGNRQEHIYTHTLNEEFRMYGSYLSIFLFFIVVGISVIVNLHHSI